MNGRIFYQFNCRHLAASPCLCTAEVCILCFDIIPFQLIVNCEFHLSRCLSVVDKLIYFMQESNSILP